MVFRFSYEAVKALANDDYCAADIPVDDEGLPATWSWVAMVCPPAKLLNIYSPEEGRTPPRREATGWAFSSHAAKSAAERAVRRMWGDCLPDAPIGSFSRSLPGSKT